VYTESVLLESRSLRSGLGDRVDVLDKVKTLALSPDGVHATTRDVAAFFEVGESAVNNLLDRYREELTENGLRVLRGADLREYQNLNVRFTSERPVDNSSHRARLAVYTRRTVLNVAMLLRDSEVARRVRAYLLDVEEETRTPSPETLASLPARVTVLESAVDDIGHTLRELGPVIHKMSVRLERVDRRLENTERIVCAMSGRLADHPRQSQQSQGCPLERYVD
jgi:hypothetical protein